jgi:hypothetical protein
MIYTHHGEFITAGYEACDSQRGNQIWHAVDFESLWLSPTVCAATAPAVAARSFIAHTVRDGDGRKSPTRLFFRSEADSVGWRLENL